MIRCKGRNFNLKKWLIVFLIFALLTTMTATGFSITSYAKPSFGEDCLSCHQSGITVSTNATGLIEVEKSTSFWLEVSASGGITRDMMLVWSNVSHNNHFLFAPGEVEDNGLGDGESETGTIFARFKISAPATEGNYFIKVYSASAQGRGGFVEVEVKVGAGGEILKDPIELVKEMVRTFAPPVLIGLAILGVTLNVFAWRKIPS